MAACQKGNRIFAFEATDRFSNYGLVGVILVDGATIEQFVMSCRTAGLEAEQAVLSCLCDVLRREGQGTITGTLVETDANLLCRTLYQRGGFARVDSGWRLDEADIVPMPAHIVIHPPERVRRTRLTPISMTGVGIAALATSADGRRGRMSSS